MLDLGCGGGFMAEALALKGAVVTGLDPAAEAIAAAVAHATSAGLNISYNVGTGETLPYADGIFDAVVCVDVLEHVSDLNAVLVQVARVLRPGGIFLFDTINRNLFARFVTVTLAEGLLRLLPPGTHDSTRFIKPEELRLGLENTGLHVGPCVGLGPCGIDKFGDLTFGRWPGTTVIYMGKARKRPVDHDVLFK